MNSRTKADKNQLDKFKAAARELGTDDDETRFNAKLKAVAKSKASKEKEADDE